ncbi:hypothetical protein AB6A40_008237 [Gnathostoma spinigerum]|uniref:Uncharacterized protein n=1 Tax=Gnathostoma spinigerum TaxID=75299 RepID=A0ABD6ENS6_9BILA
MAATMEEDFGKNLVNTDLCFLMTSGTNVFKAGAHLIVIGIEGAAKNSAFILWRLVRETIIMRWFDIPTATNIEKMAVNGAISFLAGSLVGEGRKNIDETWISTMIAKQLGDSLPVEMNERMLYERVNTRSNGNFSTYGSVNVLRKQQPNPEIIARNASTISLVSKQNPTANSPLS